MGYGSEDSRFTKSKKGASIPVNTRSNTNASIATKSSLQRQLSRLLTDHYYGAILHRIKIQNSAMLTSSTISRRYSCFCRYKQQNTEMPCHPGACAKSFIPLSFSYNRNNFAVFIDLHLLLSRFSQSRGNLSPDQFASHTSSLQCVMYQPALSLEMWVALSPAHERQHSSDLGLTKDQQPAEHGLAAPDFPKFSSTNFHFQKLIGV